MEKIANGMKKWKRGIAVSAAGILTAGLLMPWNVMADTKENETEISNAEETSATEAETENSDAAEVSENSDLLLTTNYPGVSVKPGDSATFPLYILNSGENEYDLDLTTEDIPDGWEGYFKGSSGEVSMVHAFAEQKKDDSATLSYIVNVPDDCAEGDYTITLGAGSDGIKYSTLPLSVRVGNEELGSSTFTVEYPEQQGSTDTKFSFSTTLSNNGEAATYALSADAPEGWNVTFTSSSASSQVASIPVESGSSEALTVAVTPAENTAAGDYQIHLSAVSGSETLGCDLSVTITGTYGMTLSTPTGNLSAKAYAGEATDVTLTVQNTGTIDLNNVSLTGQASTDWTVEFDQDTIDSIPAGESKEVNAKITPAKDAIIGDYVTAISAKEENTSADVQLRVSVQNHTTWGYIAVAVIAALVICLAAVIRHFGRR